MKTTWLATACILASLASRSSAQVLTEGHAVWRWEASLDNGYSWHGGEVYSTHNPGIVLVRAICSFESLGHNAYLAGAALDPYVLTPAANDDIPSTTAPSLSTSRLITTPFTPVRLAGMLKLDRSDDLAPPGEGPGWFRAQQYGYMNINEPIWDNPMYIMGFTLLLDSTPGTRTVSAVFRDVQFPGRPISVDTFRPHTVQMFQTLEQVPLTLNIVTPAPGALALGAIGLLAAARRPR